MLSHLDDGQWRIGGSAGGPLWAEDALIVRHGLGAKPTCLLLPAQIEDDASSDAMILHVLCLEGLLL